MEMKGKGAGSQGYPPRGLGQRPNSTHARESARPPGNPKSLQNLRSLQIPAHSPKCEQVTVRAKRALPKYSVAARLVLVLAIDRRQLQHHAGVSKQRTRLVGEQIQFSFGILGKAEHSQP